MEPIKRVGILSKPGIDRASEIVPPLIDWLEERGIEVRCDLQTAADLGCRAGALIAPRTYR